MSVKWETFDNTSAIEVADTLIDIRKDFSEEDISQFCDWLTVFTAGVPKDTKLEGLIINSKLLLMYAKKGLLRAGSQVQISEI